MQPILIAAMKNQLLSSDFFFKRKHLDFQKPPFKWMKLTFCHKFITKSGDCYPMSDKCRPTSDQENDRALNSPQ
ncbi:hypothetical protein GDO81_012177 [Engystomops pustulosus]|uniref:Uncharacterized protein n=1 Tax=Engystomops pustulosus TaxID=76066 RepID=A0AAV7BJN3_ENGPU|nr:hypothetical protein GDO81_012177 [Engystomops pustulosus]